jgi:hypothetical protein
MHFLFLKLLLSQLHVGLEYILDHLYRQDEPVIVILFDPQKSTHFIGYLV